MPIYTPGDTEGRITGMEPVVVLPEPSFSASRILSLLTFQVPPSAALGAKRLISVHKYTPIEPGVPEIPSTENEIWPIFRDIEVAAGETFEVRGITIDSRSVLRAHIEVDLDLEEDYVTFVTSWGDYQL